MLSLPHDSSLLPRHQLSYRNIRVRGASFSLERLLPVVSIGYLIQRFVSVGSNPRNARTLFAKVALVYCCGWTIETVAQRLHFMTFTADVREMLENSV